MRHFTVYDPEAMGSPRKAHPLLGYAVSPEEALQRAALMLHLTEWPRFRELDPGPLVSLVSRPRIVDGRGVLGADRWTAAGRQFRARGRPAPAGEGK
ncbi:UDP binding domain-containing protein [Streptomyces sp. NPDC050564]|uniref:UDP binding domain-containing protein n=1 Tax=Streptomyces sp. NPDC050564 TaxID=3365631 RepID=UPI003788325E